MDFKDELQNLINKHSQENGSDTPDFILASYLSDCLQVFNSAVCAREAWYGHKNILGGTVGEAIGSTTE